MAGLTATGIGSGIDVGSLVSQLVSAERAPLANRLNLSEAKAQSKLSAFGSLKSALETFQNKLDQLTNLDTYKKRAATVGDSDVFKVDLDTAAAAGNYSVQVEQLATQHKIASGAYTDSDTSVGTGDLTFIVNGESFTVAIASGSDSLVDIRDAINNADDNVGVSASIVTDEDGAHLVFTSDKSGSANAITVSATVGAGDTGDLTALNFDPQDIPGSALTQKVEALDSIVIVDGFTQTSSDLSVSGLIEGVTINLLEARPGEKIDLAVSLDKSAVRKTVEGFVASYNTLRSTINNLTAYDPESNVAAVLQGDFTTRSIATRLQQQLGGVVKGLDPALDSLAEIGITTADGGKLELDSSKLDAVLSDNFEAVSGLFGGENGFATKLSNSIEAYVGSGGILQTRTDGLQSQIDRIGDKREALDRRMLIVEARYAAQFNAMDALLGQLTSTGDYLNQQLSNLPGVVRNTGK